MLRSMWFIRQRACASTFQKGSLLLFLSLKMDKTLQQRFSGFFSVHPQTPHLLCVRISAGFRAAPEPLSRSREQAPSERWHGLQWEASTLLPIIAEIRCGGIRFLPSVQELPFDTFLHLPVWASCPEIAGQFLRESAAGPRRPTHHMRAWPEGLPAAPNPPQPQPQPGSPAHAKHAPQAGAGGLQLPACFARKTRGPLRAGGAELFWGM